MGLNGDGKERVLISFCDGCKSMLAEDVPALRKVSRLFRKSSIS
jgi:hypothetical protein